VSLNPIPTSGQVVEQYLNVASNKDLYLYETFLGEAFRICS
jgi:hypothetical protein